MGYLEEYKKWCEDVTFDEETRKEMLSIKDNDKEIKDRFYKELEFGTAGLRGVIGNGTNRMNKYTVGKATQGLANFILKKGTQNKGVVISFDSRNMSPEFSKQTALILNANGIKTYIMDKLRPVPELSFAVRELKATAGIMITASHNPAKYNGYKVYWDDGAQIVPPNDKDIIAEVNNVKYYSEIKTMKEDEAVRKGLYNVIGKDIDDKYIEALKKCVLNPEIVKEQGKNIKIVYTPLHGAGNELVQRILKEIGFENVYVVPEQEKPDGNFPTVKKPNPESKEAFELALKLGKEKDADIVLATDPDADRLGIYAKDSKTGKYMSFTGNMSGMLIAEYEISQKKEKGILPKNGMIVTSIVSTNMARDVANAYGLELVECLTGFKYIGETIRKSEENNDRKFVFGFEESYGCLIDTYARDKDAVSAVMVLCEAAAYYKTKGLTLWDKMIEMFEEYGYYNEGQVSIELEGADGAEKIKKIMTSLKEKNIEKIGKYRVLKFKDYENEKIKDMRTGEISKTNLPKAKVLYYELENNCWCCIRPSGTEPIIKLYVAVRSNNIENSEKELEEMKKNVKELVENL